MLHAILQQNKKLLSNLFGYYSINLEDYEVQKKKELYMQAHPFHLSKIHLKNGPFKERQDIHKKYLLSIEEDRLIAPFREQAGLPLKAKRYGGWEARDIAGHSLGHYLSALSIMYATTNDEIFLTKVKYIIDELEKCQDANGDGYLFPLNKKLFNEIHDGKIETTAFSLNKIWVPFYTMHKIFAGLRDAYRYTNYKKAIDIEIKLADWLATILSPLSHEQIQNILKCEHGGMNEVLTDLYLDTGNNYYLVMAENYFHHDAVLCPIEQGKDNLNGLHANTQIPKIIGIAKQYNISKNKNLQEGAKNFWDNVVFKRSYCIGGNSESEHFFPPEKFPEKLTTYTAETCNTYNMLKLTGILFSWEQEAKYMDFVERALINHILANIGRQPGEFGYFLGLDSVGIKVFSTQFDSWWCCVGTGLENPARYGEYIYYYNDSTLWVNLFIGSQLNWPEKGIKLTQETDFPEGTKIKLLFSCKNPINLTLKLRHPYWCKKPVIKLNSKEVLLKSIPSSYISIESTWKNGDVMEVELPMDLRIETLPFSNGKIIALMYGPMVMAAIVSPDKDENNPARKRFSNHLLARGKTDEIPPILIANTTNEIISSIKPTGKSLTEFESNTVTRPKNLTFIPLYKIYQEHYAVYFHLITKQEWLSKENEYRSREELEIQKENAIIDLVQPGFQQSEIEHNIQSVNSNIIDFMEHKGRNTEINGWFSYDMRVNPSTPMQLIVTYWGGNWTEYNFDILIDKQKIASQKLHIDKPGDFIDITYDIPLELTHNKNKVTVSFNSQPEKSIPGIFLLKMIKK